MDTISNTVYRVIYAKTKKIALITSKIVPMLLPRLPRDFHNLDRNLSNSFSLDISQTLESSNTVHVKCYKDAEMYLGF